MNEVKVSYRGWGGHFIAANRCKFRLNALIEYKEIKIVVSTVGLMELVRGSGEYETIGHERHFETMAFHAKKEGKFWDADVSKQIDFKSERSYSSQDDEWKANKGHWAVVEELKTSLLATDKMEKDLTKEEIADIMEHGSQAERLP